MSPEERWEKLRLAMALAINDESTPPIDFPALVVEQIRQAEQAARAAALEEAAGAVACGIAHQPGEACHLSNCCRDDIIAIRALITSPERQGG